MAVEVVERKRTATVCGGCGEELEAGISKADGCPKCKSHDFKRSLTIVRKAVGDEDDDLENELEDEEDEVEEDEEDDEENEDELEDEKVLVTASKRGKKLDPNLLGVEVLNISTAFAEDIVKAFTGDGDYEETMTEFNNIMDAAAEKWVKGHNVSKAADTKGHTSLIRDRVNAIVKEKEGTKMPKRPATLDGLELPDDVKSYIAELEGEGVEKADDPYKDLPEPVQKSLKAADKIVEEREQEKWLEVAKAYKHFPGDKVELAKSLRKLSETDESAYTTLKNTLDAGEHNLEQSSIFKSFGAPGGGEPGDEVSKRTSAAQKLVDDGKFPTIEQAEASLLDAKAYKPTNA